MNLCAPVNLGQYAMTGEERCGSGAVECEYSETHELPLVQRVLESIQQYNREKNTDPCPECLRDAMLAVAALLHMEAERLLTSRPLADGLEVLEEAFGSVAREKLRAVVQVAATSPLGLKQ
jgi:hypothetical protein